MATSHGIKTRTGVSERRLGARPSRARAAAPADLEQTLKLTTLRLRCTRAVVSTSVGALRLQNADLDPEIATVLQHVVVNSLSAEIDQLERIASRLKP